jgi:hypothetical protein
MPRSGGGVYSKPAGTTAVTNTTIESAKYNSVIDDLVADANAARPISAGGTGGVTAAAARTNLAIELGEFTPAGSGAVVRTIQAKLRESVNAADHGAVGDGVANDTTAMHNGMAAAVAGGIPYMLNPGKTYLVGQLVIPAGLTLYASGATIRHNGSTTGSQLAVDIGANVTFDEIVVTTPGTETATDLIRIGTGVKGERLIAIADVQRADGGITTTGQNVRIGRIETDKIDRPLHAYNLSVTPVTGFDVGYLSCRSYVRAFRADNVSGRLGGLRAVVRSANAVVMTAGQNGVLFIGCADFELGDCWIEDASEHSIRIGGSAAGTKTKNLRIGNITAIRSNGCPLKINPTLLVSPGVTETADNVTVGDILAVDVGVGALAGNKEILRLTHCRNVQIGDVLASVDAQTVSGQYGLQINDAQNVQIASLGGPFNAGCVSIDGTSDVDGVSFFGSHVTNLRIGRLHGSVPGTNAIGVNTAFNVGDVHIHCDGLRGFTTNLLRWISGTLTDVVRLTGWTAGSVVPAYQGAPVDTNFQVDITHANARHVGRASGLRGTAAVEIIPPVFSSASQAPNGLMLNNTRATAGSGNYGSAIEFTRLASSRRAAAIAARQGSADDKEVGIDFFVGDVSTTSNEALLLALRLTYLRRLELVSSLTTYADNAAAVSGGLAVGTVYWTSTGELRIVV